MAGSTKRQLGFDARTYSLNEAAGIRRQYLDSSQAPACPRCDTPLKLLEGGNAEESFVLAVCPYCAVSLLMPLSGNVAADVPNA
jgi:hypothetical protein